MRKGEAARELGGEPAIVAVRVLAGKVGDGLCSCCGTPGSVQRLYAIGASDHLIAALAAVRTAHPMVCMH